MLILLFLVMDGDFAMYIGVSSSTDMMIWSPKIDYGTSSFKSAQLVTGQKHIMRWINNSLQVKGPDNYFPVDARYPIFDEMTDPICRALFAVALGCDVFPRGLRAFGPAKALAINIQADNLSTIEEQRDHIVEKILSFNKQKIIDRVSLLCYAQSILYELTCNVYIYSEFDTQFLIQRSIARSRKNNQ